MVNLLFIKNPLLQGEYCTPKKPDKFIFFENQNLSKNNKKILKCKKKNKNTELKLKIGTLRVKNLFYV